MISYNAIDKVNKEIQTTEIKGNQYAAVSERIKAFRKLYPEGFICTDLISNENGVCIIKATVGYKDELGERFVLGTGMAYEKEGSSFINKTSYIENCETSAVGRALGMCGLGIDADVASYDEVATATVNQEAEKPISAEQKKALTKMMKEDNIPDTYICELYSVGDIKELTVRKFTNLVSNWEACKTKYAERQKGEECQ